MSKDGGPAFPVQDQVNEWGYAMQPGMSLRDYFAGQALVGIGSWYPDDVNLRKDRVWYTDTEKMTLRAKWAYNQADAMLAAREKDNKA